MKEQLRRQKDRERKQFERVLKVFETLSLKSKQYNFKYICIIQKEDGEVHYNGTSELNKNFQDNQPILPYQDSNMIETRRDSILHKINLTSTLKEAVRPSPFKGHDTQQGHMSFLPGLSPPPYSVGQVQKINLLGMVPQCEQSVAIDSDHIVELKKRTFTRKRRPNPKTRLEMLDHDVKEPKRGRKVQKKK